MQKVRWKIDRTAANFYDIFMKCSQESGESMHEPGLNIDVADMAEKIAAEQLIARVKKVVPDVGEL